MSVYNYNKLRGLIKEHLGTQEAYANAIGISSTTLSTRLKGESYFNQKEIEKSAEMFGLNSDEINATFFCKQTTENRN